MIIYLNAISFSVWFVWTTISGNSSTCEKSRPGEGASKPHTTEFTHCRYPSDGILEALATICASEGQFVETYISFARFYVGPRLMQIARFPASRSMLTLARAHLQGPVQLLPPVVVSVPFARRVLAHSFIHSLAAFRLVSLFKIWTPGWVAPSSCPRSKKLLAHHCVWGWACNRQFSFANTIKTSQKLLSSINMNRSRSDTAERESVKPEARAPPETWHYYLPSSIPILALSHHSVVAC